MFSVAKSGVRHRNTLSGIVRTRGMNVTCCSPRVEIVRVHLRCGRRYTLDFDPHEHVFLILNDWENAWELMLEFCKEGKAERAELTPEQAAQQEEDQQDGCDMCAPRVHRTRRSCYHYASL